MNPNDLWLIHIAGLKTAGCKQTIWLQSTRFVCQITALESSEVQE